MKTAVAIFDIESGTMIKSIKEPILIPEVGQIVTYTVVVHYPYGVKEEEKVKYRVKEISHDFLDSMYGERHRIELHCEKIGKNEKTFETI